MMAFDNYYLVTAVEQTVDSLCFHRTHCVDTDYRAMSLNTVDAVMSLQAEQLVRLENNYGPARYRHAAIASQLEEIYMEDAKNVAECRKTGEPSVVDAMTSVAAKIFKRDMKQRIHEWESAFREETGRLTLEDKSRLRLIYELYKAVKNKVQAEKPEDDAAQSPPHTAGAPIAPSTSRTNRPIPQMRQGAGSSPHHHHPYAPNQQVGTVTPSRPSTATTGGAVPSPSLSVARPSPGVAHPSPMTAHDSATPNDNEPLNALVAEKRALKRKLHEFEESFERQYGRKPNKEDRKDMAKEYSRYSELKTLLAKNM